MAWEPFLPAPRRASWRREVRRGPRPAEGSPYAADAAVRDRVIASTFGTQVTLVLGFATLIAIAAVFYAQYSGAVRWLLAIVVLASSAYVVARFVGTRARDPRPLGTAQISERRASGDLRSLATTLDRASSGLKYSQVMFAARMKDAFLEKVRLARGFAPDDLARIRADPVALLELIGDRELVLFVLESERNGRHWPSLIRYLPTRSAFRNEADRILAKMEAWR